MFRFLSVIFHSTSFFNCHDLYWDINQHATADVVSRQKIYCKLRLLMLSFILEFSLERIASFLLLQCNK